MSDYVDPDIILVPYNPLNLCEKCGKLYGNCKHHPLTVKRKVITKAELEKHYKDNKPTYTNLDKI